MAAGKKEFANVPLRQTWERMEVRWSSLLSSVWYW